MARYILATQALHLGHTLGPYEIIEPAGTGTSALLAVGLGFLVQHFFPDVIARLPTVEGLPVVARHVVVVLALMLIGVGLQTVWWLPRRGGSDDHA